MSIFRIKVHSTHTLAGVFVLDGAVKGGGERGTALMHKSGESRAWLSDGVAYNQLRRICSFGVK